MRTLDDVYGAELDQFPLEQDLRLRPATLRWEDTAEGRALLPDWFYDPARGPWVPRANPR